MGALTILRTGAWLTNERIRLVALAMLIASVLGVIFLVVTADGYLDIQGRPLGTDFSNIYVAGTYVLEGRPAAPYDLALQIARAQAIFGPDTPIYGWHYPPYVLGVAGALALMPYGLALAAWQAVTFLLYLLSMQAIVATASVRASSPPATAPVANHLWLLLVSAFPAVFINVGHGHNGFLTAALMGGALIQLDRRPVVAGILFALLVYKPQFGLMIPLILAATGRWRTLAAGIAAVAALTLCTTLAFGPAVWTAFFDSTRFTREVVLETGGIGWYKIQSVFSWVRMWGGSVAIAYAVQLAAALGLGATLVWLWRSGAAFALKASALCIAAILATPYSLDYDMMILAPAIGFLAADGLARGFRPWEKTALAVLWLMPAIARNVTLIVGVPLGVAAMITLFIMILRRAAADLGAQAQVPSSLPPGIGTPA